MQILIATDGSTFSKGAIEYCCALFKGTADLSILVLAVYEPIAPGAAEHFTASTGYHAEMTRVAEKIAETARDHAIETIKGSFREEKPKIEAAVELGRPVEVIVEKAARWPADLIVVGSHGRGFWGRLTLGSVSSAVVQHSPCSVLVVRGKQK